MNSPDQRKSWIYRIRYLKLLKKTNSSAFKEQNSLPENITDWGHQKINSQFHYNMTPNLNSEKADLKSESNFRRSLRKWHKRIKNCFSKQTRGLEAAPRDNTSIIPEFLRTTDLDSAIPVSEQPHSHTTFEESLTPCSSRLAIDSDNQLQSPTLSHLSENSCTPKNEVSSLAHQVWYWGPVPKQLVEAKLEGAPDGSFLVRDSASDRHIFTISFRSVGKTLHTRIDRTKSGYKVFDHKGFETVQDLIDEAVRTSAEESLFCYTKSQGIEPNYPVRLLKPISRYDEVRPLQNLSRFVIRQHINVNDIDKLCLPFTLISFLKEDNYF